MHATHFALQKLKKKLSEAADRDLDVTHAMQRFLMVGIDDRYICTTNFVQDRVACTH